MRSYWHFCALDAEGRPVMRDGTLVEVGKRYEIDGDPILCKRGYHGSLRAPDALKYAPGWWVSKRPLEGVIAGDDKVVGRAYVQQPGADVTEALCKFARMCALDVIHLWDAPEIVVQYLKTGDGSLRTAAWVAARDAAQDAAHATVHAAARAAAQAAAHAAAEAAAQAAAHAAAQTAAQDAAWDTAQAAARAAAQDAAWAAEKAAAWVTAWGAAERDEAYAGAWAAVRQRQNRRLTRMLNAALRGGN